MKNERHLDDIDLRIINILLEDSRKSSRQIARELKVTHQTVISRLRHLEENDFIKGYTAIVNWTKLGYSVKTLFLIEAGKLDEEKLARIQEYINAEHAFTAAGTLSGDFDLYIIGKFRTQEDALAKTTALRSFLGKETDLRVFRTYPVWKIIQETRPTRVAK